MDALELYDDADRERLVPEPPKRLDVPGRTPFERDRARVVHAAASRRLAAKTQVVGPGTDDFVRNRLTHSLEVAQVARDLARALGCQPDIAETAALAHDLGHPPFGHNGERALEAVSADCGGFEGNAQTLRILSRLEAKTFGPDGSVGLNLTRATLDACTKYPWTRSDAEDPEGVNADGSPREIRKFGVYDDDVTVFGWLRAGVPGRRLCVEAQVMDLADDVAYSVHDIEDGIVAGRIDLTRLDLDAVWQTVREWYVPSASDGVLDEVLSDLRSQVGWPVAPYDGGRRGQAALKDLTSDLIGRFCGAVQAATFASSLGPVRATSGRPGGARADQAGDRRTQGHRRPLRDAGRRPGGTDDPAARPADRPGERPARPRTRCVGDSVRRGLEGGGRRRRPLPRGHRPGRVVDRCVGGRLARPAGGSMSEPLVWLPFEVDDLPDGLRCEIVPDPAHDLPASRDEVEGYVLPYRFEPGDSAFLDRLPRLRFVQSLTAGVEHLAGRIPPGVTLCSGRGIHSASTAELAVTLILSSLRGIPEFVLAQQRQDWIQQERPALADKRVLIVGYGDIGAAIDRRLTPFEVEVVKVARTARDDVHAMTELPELLPHADVVVVVTPLTDETRHLVDAAFLAAMPDGALLVNVARGGVVDTEALVAALTRRAGSTPLSTSPTPSRRPRVTRSGPLRTCCSHRTWAGSSSAFLPRAKRLVREQLARFAAGQPLLNQVESGG